MNSGNTEQQGATIYPALRYRDARKALHWLHEAFGFERTVVVPGDGDTVAHAEMRLGAGVIMFGSAPEGTAVPAATDPRTAPFSLYVAVDDPDAHCARARAAGAEITMEPVDQEYGSREYAAKDVEGYHWTFGTYRP